MTTPASRSCCPHLGLNSDRTILLISPTMAHRCYVQPEPLLPDPDRQAHFCLNANHTQCPLYAPISPRAVALTSSAGAPEKLPLLATATSPMLAPQTTQLVRVKQPPLRPPNANRILLPRRQQTAMARRRAPKTLLLPAVSSYSARRLHRWSFFSTKVTLAATILLAFLTVTSSVIIRRQQPATVRTYQASNLFVVSVNPAPTFTQTPLAVAILNAAVNPTATPAPLVTMARFVTPTPPPGGQGYYLTPGNNSAGWWMSNDDRRNHVNDSFLYVGQNGGEAYIAAIRFDLRNIPRGAAIVHGEVRLTGVRADNLTTAPATWQLQLIAEEALPNLASADFLSLLSAPAALSLLPAINEQALVIDAVNRWQFDAEATAWLQEQLLLGATAITMRLTANTNGQDTLFAWDSGVGAATTERGPVLLLSVGPPPATPPLLPTKPFMVATHTPAPANVLTVVAANSTATAVAVTTGTYTPVPYQVVTPTPFPANLATVQAVALDRGLPPVLLATTTPVNPAEATGNAEYATAVAVTTGTFTPVPTGFVTPVLVVPSPPVENVATEAARSLEATAVAASGADTPTPLPYNAVIADYVYATPAPENEATAQAQAVIATAAALIDGTPTPLAWNAIVITKMPTPLPPVSPSSTPLPSLQPITDFTPTPTPTTFFMPDVMPAIYRNKIVFKTSRSGQEETYALDPNSGELFRVNEPWVHDLAFRQLAFSPNRQEQALVLADANRELQIQVRSLQYDIVRQLTTFKGMSYDPAWSPLGDKIAFVSTDSGSDEIYLVTTDGSILQQLTNNNNLWDKHPSWSPDGTQIVFFSNRDGGRRQLWIMNADGSNQRNISNNSHEDWNPIWVP